MLPSPVVPILRVLMLLRFFFSESFNVVCKNNHFLNVLFSGSLDTETMQVYSMVTLDTIFVRRSYRRRGLASDSVVNLSREFSPPNNIGFSYPLSKGMLRGIISITAQFGHARSKGRHTHGRRQAYIHTHTLC